MLPHKIKCKRCGIEFEKYPSIKSKYCSRSCYFNKNKIKPKTLLCPYCHKPLKTKEDIKSGFHRDSYKDQLQHDKQEIPRNFESIRR